MSGSPAMCAPMQNSSTSFAAAGGVATVSPQNAAPRPASRPSEKAGPTKVTPNGTGPSAGTASAARSQRFTKFV